MGCTRDHQRAPLHRRGVSLWATQPWGWLFAHYLAIFGLIEAVFVMIANNSLTDGLAVALFPLLVIWYLNNKDVKATFGLESLA